MSPRSRQRATEFLSVSHLYRLGELPTEQPHPDTADLSVWAADDLPRAVSVLEQIDLDALRALRRRSAHIDVLAAKIRATLGRGRRVYLCGCGATGRLALSLEHLWRRRHGAGDDRVRSFMAGGDVALVHALEGFEDHPAYGARHLEQAGFSDGDLLIGCTEGGETPYVIGATERAAEISGAPPSFLYCNPDPILAQHVERFRRLRDNGGIDRHCLDAGRMALTGSTRMQASTVLQLAVGIALLGPPRPAGDTLDAYLRLVEATDLSFLPRFIRQEAAIYAAGDHIVYRTDGYGITVLTDTTERAPTFSLVPFGRLGRTRQAHSLCHVSLTDAADPAAAWERLLGRSPRRLDWPEVDARTTLDYLRGFDFSAKAGDRRRREIPGRRHVEFRIDRSERGITLCLEGEQHEVGTNGASELFRHLLLKQILNIHSTLVMGRLGRYEGNLMTWVTPTNGKLIDRAARYTAHLLDRSGLTGHTYEEIVGQIFAEMERAAPGEPVVPRACRSLMRRRAAS